MIAVAQQMGEAVRQFGVVYQDEVRAGGAVQVDQIRPQADLPGAGAGKPVPSGPVGVVQGDPG
ncbi:hypothetical protein ACIBMX_46975 [Streptomyces phaeochromogenes]|uniref:hypothetical protein n=1 Tax=Streptomyces phaeochromogenes TaxID=1923 RepID=UPI0033C28148